MKKPSGNRLVWRKAAVLGSLWAASEIVLGSFLHNARVPFSGEFLTAIGIAILVAGHRLWPERGLLWRAGLVCAAMKSVSPSAVIFGPMAAITMEGLLAEAGVRLLGGNSAGYSLAGGLAMSWALLQKIATMLILYGPDAAAVYVRGVERLRAFFALEQGNLWGPLTALLAGYFLAGAAAAAAGIRAGKAEAGGTAPFTPRGKRKENAAPRTALKRPSLWSLTLHLLFVAAVMAAGRKIPAAALCGLAGAYALICASLYPRASALLRRAGIWAGVLGVSLLAGLILGSAVSGLYMALRAFMLTTAFAAIGEELLNPSIRSALERLGGGVFLETLEYAFASLPGVIADFPSGRDIARRPVTSLRKVISAAPLRLEPEAAAVYIITGAHGSGKSKLVMELAQLLREAGKKPGGICAAGLWENGVRSGFDLIDLAYGARVPLCRRGATGGAASAGEFRFYREGLEAGLAALSAEALAGADAVFIDEIGFLELDGGGWADRLGALLEKNNSPLVLVARDYLLDRVRARWSLGRAIVWKTGEIPAETAFSQLNGRVQGEFIQL